MTTFHAARKLEKTKKRPAGEAPKHHTKKPKTSISVAGLFAKKPRAVREGLQSSDGISRKSRSAEDDITAKAKRHPIYADVKDALGVYAQDGTCSVFEELDTIHDELTARIKNISINSKPAIDTIHDELTARVKNISINSKPANGHPAAKDTKVESALCRPLSEDVLTVSVSRPNGSIARRDVQLGDSMKKMAKLIDDTKAKVTRLKEELDEVNEDIGSVLKEYQEVTKSVCKMHEAKKAVFLSDVQAFHTSVVDDIVAARLEDKKHSVEAQRKLQAFAASLV